MIDRISGDAVEWITLRDAFLYVWKRLKNSKVAQSELREKLEAGVIGARAEILEKFDLTERCLNSDWTDDATAEPHETIRRTYIVQQFWGRAAVDWSGGDFAQSVASPYLFKVRGISIRRDDVFHIWPPVGAAIDTGTVEHATARPMPVAKNELINFLLTTFDGQTTRKEAFDRAKTHFVGHAIPDSLWRSAMQAVPANKKLQRGDTAKTRAKRAQ